MENMQINAELIKQFRQQKCWSQQQLADMSGVSLRTLQRLEAKSVASQETIKSLAAVLEVDCQLLLKTEENVGSTEAVTVTEDKGKMPDPSQKRSLYIAMITIILVSVFAFFTVFEAYEVQKLTHGEFQFFKGLVSFSLLLGLAGVLYRAYKMGLVSRSDFL